MPQLELHFLHENRRPIYVDDVIPVKGMTYVIEDTASVRSYVVTLVRRRLLPKSRYQPDAPAHEYLIAGAVEVVLVSSADVARGS